MGRHVRHARRVTCGPGRGYRGRVPDLPSRRVCPGRKSADLSNPHVAPGEGADSVDGITRADVALGALLEERQRPLGAVGGPHGQHSSVVLAQRQGARLAFHAHKSSHSGVTVEGDTTSGGTQWLFTAGQGVLPLITLSGTALGVVPMTIDPSASEVLMRMLAETALVIAFLSVTLRFIFPVVIILIIVVLLGGSPGKLLASLAVRAASAAFWLLGMRGLGIRPPGSAEGLGFRMKVGSDLTFVQLRGGTGRITANDPITVVGRRTVEGVVRAYFVRHHGDGSWIIAKGVLSRCVVTAVLLYLALSRVLR
jgi:hypothetical protein